MTLDINFSAYEGELIPVFDHVRGLVDVTINEFMETGNVQDNHRILREYRQSREKTKAELVG